MSDFNEIWKDIKGYEGLYQVSNLGNVRSFHKGSWNLLSNVINKRGYKQYLLHKDGKRKNMRGNRLVAEAFIPNPNNYPIVNHKDENPSNDCVNNLEWCSAKYNINYGSAINRRSKNNIKNRKIHMFEVDGTFIKEFYNISEASKFIGGTHTCILRCCKGNVYCYKGYIWRYAEEVDTIHQAIINYKTSKTNRKIEVYIDGETIIFNSLSEASRTLKISRDTLKKNNSKGNITWKII